MKSFVDYQEYITSPDWIERASQAKARAGYRCQVCNKPQSVTKLHAHHRTYERLGQEMPADITILCETCHNLFHGQTKRD